MQPKRLAILGVGLLGGSIGLAVKSILKDCKVTGYAHRAETRQAALDKGAIDEAYAEPADSVRGADLVVLCPPVGKLAELLSLIAPALAPGAVVTDVGSTKREIVAHARQVLPAPDGPWFVGSHPMAGSEKRGVQFAQADLFQGALCIVTPESSTNPQALRRVGAFWESLGMWLRYLSPDEHDRLVADVSHVPHAAAAALIALQSEQSLALRGRGFVDATRIAAGDPGLWRDILLSNRDNLTTGIRRLQGKLDELVKLVEAGDGKRVEEWLDAAARRRQTL